MNLNKLFKLSSYYADLANEPWILGPNMNHGLIKTAILLLIGVDTLSYGYLGDEAKFIDSCAWLWLMILFEAENSHWNGKTERPRIMLACLRFARTLAILAILASNFSYVKSADWLDIVNSLLWYGVIFRLEWLARWPHKSSGQIYLVLLLPVMAWLWLGDWLDAWDGVLWFVALLVIDQPKASSGHGNQSGEVIPAKE